MASVEIKKIRLNSGTTYNIKDSRIPALTNNTTTFLRSDGTWADPTANLPETLDVVDNGTYITIQPTGSTQGVILQSKTGITPSTSSQTITPDSGYDGLSSVQINAVPSGTVSAPTSISGSSATVSIGTNTLTLTKTISVTPNVSTAGYISAGTATNSSVTLTASVTTKAAATITPTTSNQSIAAGTYLTGAQTINGDSNLVAGNIKSGTSIFGVRGTYETPFEAPTFTLTFTNNGTTLSSVTCDKTYAQCVNYTNSDGNTWYARILWTDGSHTQKLSGAIFHDNSVTNSPYYCYVETNTEGIATYKIIYASDGTITWEENPVELIACPKFTINYSNNTVTCNKTFAECMTYANNGIFIGAVINPDSSVAAVTIDNVDESQIIYKAASISSGYGISEGVITYSSSGTITMSFTTIDERSSSDLTVSGATVTAPAGYYPSAASKAVASMTLPTAAASSATSGFTSKATIGRSASAQYINIPTGYNAAGAYYTISAMPNGSATAPSSISGTSATVSTGTNTLTLTKTVSVTPSVSAGYVSAGTAGNSSISLTASVTTKAAATITPGTSNQTIAAGTYITGTQTISGDADLTAANIKKDVQIFGVTGTYTSDATAAAADIVSGKTAYVNGSKLTGTLTFQTYYTGSSAPASSLGANGDIYLQT